MLMLPSAPHFFDLHFSDICKYGVEGEAVSFCNVMTQCWQQHHLPKIVLERCQRAEYGKTIHQQRPGTTR